MSILYEFTKSVSVMFTSEEILEFRDNLRNELAKKVPEDNIYLDKLFTITDDEIVSLYNDKVTHAREFNSCEFEGFITEKFEEFIDYAYYKSEEISHECKAYVYK